MTRGKKIKKKNETEPSAKNEETEECNSLSDTNLSIIDMFDTDEIQELISLLNVSEIDKFHSLVGAAALGKIGIAEQILENSQSLDVTTEGLTPLLWAVKLKQTDMAVFLIERGADLKVQDEAGNNFLMIALQSKDWTQDLFVEFWMKIKDLIEDLNVTNKAGVGLIHLLVKNQWDEMLQLILDESSRQMSVNCATHKGVTALMMACSRHQQASVETLLTHSADLLIEDNRGCTAVCYAIAFFIQKRMKLPNKIIEAVFHALEKQSSLGTYVERKLCVLLGESENLRRQAVSSFTIDIMTFLTRCQTNGVDLLIELEIFNRIRSALDKFIEDHDYVLGLLNIVSEILRYCDCCANGSKTELLIDEFHEAEVPQSCLNILKRLSECRYPKTFSHIVLMPILLTCFKPRTECWLKRNYKSLAIFHQRCISVPLPFRNVYPDEVHSDKILKDIARFKGMMESLQDDNSRKKRFSNKKMKKFKPPTSGEGDESASQTSSSPPVGPAKTNPNFRLKRPNQPFHFNDTMLRTREEFDCPTCVFSKISSESESLDPDEWGKDDDTDSNVPQEGIKTCIHQLDCKFKRIMAQFERKWQREYAAGYLEASGGVEDCEKLMRVLPGLEWKHWTDVVSQWTELTDKIKSTWFQDSKHCTSMIKKIGIYLEDLTSQIEMNRTTMTTDYISLLQEKINNSEYFAFKQDDSVNSPDSSFLSSSESEITSSRCSIKEYFDDANKLDSLKKEDFKEVRLYEDAIIPKVTEFTCTICRNLSDKFYPQRKCNDIEAKLKLLKQTSCQEDVTTQVKLPLVEDVAKFKISDAGSFGILLMGIDARTETPLAVKTVCSKDNDHEFNHFFRILPVLVRLHSLNLLPYSHWLSNSDQIVLATPLCDKNVGEYIYLLKRNDQFTIPHARIMIKQVVKGLHYLHTQPTPVIHGNLKPSNILVDFHGNLRLADFGLHEILFRNSTPPISTMIWWAQESYTAYEESGKLVVSKDSDTQSCGMLLHYIITGGIHPFGNHPQDIVQSLKQGRPTVCRQNEEISDLIRWSLAHEPDQRPNTHMMLGHVFNWNLEKRWKFVLTCAGVPTGTKLLSLPTRQLHASLDTQAKKFCVQTKWINILEHHMNAEFQGNAYTDSISGLLAMLRETWPKSASWFFVVFPLLPLTLFRLLEGSEWVTHEDFSQFVPSFYEML